MLRIVPHIEYLLQRHDCVIIPGVGGFVLQSVFAAVDADSHSFSPIKREIVFNPTLQHNDGLLTELYMKIAGCAFERAWLTVEEDISELKSTLQKDGLVQLGSVGQLHRSADGLISFFAGDCLLFSQGSYGLPVFQVRTLQDLRREEEAAMIELKKQKTDTIYIPVSRKLLQGVATTAAAIAMFLLVSTPVKDVNRSAYSASVIPVNMMTIKSDHVVEEIAEMNLPVAMPEVTEVITSEPEPLSVERKVKKKMYHIVIGSFVTHKQADDFIKKVDRSFFPAIDRIERDDRIRVYANKFETREDAESYLQTVRDQPKYKDAWLFISR